MRFVALLRGVNVGGNTMIKMADLRSALENAGFENVASYINSGNLAFDAEKASEEKLAEKVAKVIADEFDKDIPVMIRDRSAIEKILKADPFAGEYETHKQMHVLFMKEAMPLDKEKQLMAEQTKREKFAVIGKEIYALLLDGVADSLLGKGFIDKKLKIPTTGRNWRTLQKLSEL